MRFSSELSRIARASLASLALAWMAPGGVEGADPSVRPPPLLLELEPAAAQPGSTALLTISGKYLDDIQGILADHPGIVARAHEEKESPEEGSGSDDAKDGDSRRRRRRDGASRQSLQFDLSVAADVPPGLYELRAYNAYGISPPRALHVSSLPVSSDRDPRRSEPVAIELNHCYSGHVERGEAEVFTLRSEAEQRILVECYGERIDSQIDATLEVLHPASGRSLAFSMDERGSDPIVAFDAGAGEEYRIELWDLTYQDRMPYLLVVSASAPRALFAFPPVLGAAGPDSLEVFGWNLPGGERLSTGRLSLERLRVEAGKFEILAGAPDAFRTYRSTRSLLRDTVEARPPFPGAEPLVLLRSPEQVEIEKEAGDGPESAMSLGLASMIAGRFDSARDRDWYVFEAKKNDVLEISVHSARLGFRCDPIMVLTQRELSGETEKVRDRLLMDERETGISRENSIRQRFIVGERDPITVWTVPEDGKYYLMIRNRNGRHGLSAVYVLRLRIARPDFELYAIPSEVQIGGAATVFRDGATTYDVLLERRGGFEGAVEVRAEELPDGVSAAPVVVGPGESYVPLVLSAAGDAPEFTGNIRIVGRSLDGAETLERQATGACTVYGLRETRHPLQYTHSRFCRALPLAVRASEAPFAVRLDVESKAVPPGAKLSLPVHVDRHAGYEGEVKLALQGFNEKGFPNDNGERPAKKTVGKDRDAETVELTVSNRTKYGAYTFVVYGSAEFEYRVDPSDRKSRKGKFWRTSAARPVRIDVQPPATLEFDGFGGSAASAAGADGGKAVDLALGSALKIPFRVHRLEGVDDRVEVELKFSGNKKGLKSSKVTVPKDRDRGELVLECSPDSPLEEIRELEVSTRVRYAGRTFDETVPLPITVRRVAAKDGAGGAETPERGN